MSDADDWKIFQRTGEPHDRINRLEEICPPWRRFETRNQERAENYRPGPDEVEMVNAALYLRRPLLVTGPPGSGKSSLAYAVARQLGLGTVLHWPINSRSSLADGLYTYDAIGRLRDANLERTPPSPPLSGSDAGQGPPQKSEPAKHEDIGRYITLNWLGTALLPSERPRVLLIDEIDKSDIDLPNDLLHAFEEGSYEIPELVRIQKEQPEVEVATRDPGKPRVTIKEGRVDCHAFPFVLLTSNGERDLPPAFFRRCLRIEIKEADEARLKEIVGAHFAKEPVDGELINKLIAKFLEVRRPGALLANDQLLNAIFLIGKGRLPDAPERDELVRQLMRELNQ